MFCSVEYDGGCVTGCRSVRISCVNMWLVAKFRATPMASRIMGSDCERNICVIIVIYVWVCAFVCWIVNTCVCVCVMLCVGEKEADRRRIFFSSALPSCGAMPVSSRILRTISSATCTWHTESVTQHSHSHKNNLCWGNFERQDMCKHYSPTYAHTHTVVINLVHTQIQTHLFGRRSASHLHELTDLLTESAKARTDMPTNGYIQCLGCACRYQLRSYSCYTCFLVAAACKAMPSSPRLCQLLYVYHMNMVMNIKIGFEGQVCRDLERLTRATWLFSQVESE